MRVDAMPASSHENYTASDFVLSTENCALAGFQSSRKPMAHTIIGLCTLELHLAGLQSLKEKRRIIKTMLTRLQNCFNVSAAEVAYLDSWQSAVIAIVTVSNSTPHVQQVIGNTVKWIESNFPDAYIVRQEIEIL